MTAQRNSDTGAVCKLISNHWAMMSAAVTFVEWVKGYVKTPEKSTSQILSLSEIFEIYSENY